MEHNYKSSFYFTTITPFTSDDYRKAKHIINHIIENPESFEFRQPVDWQGISIFIQGLALQIILKLSKILWIWELSEVNLKKKLM